MQTKVCSICKQDKKTSEFICYRIDGKLVHENNCKGCQPNRICSSCNIRKDFSEFRWRKNGKGSSHCKKCISHKRERKYICKRCELEKSKDSFNIKHDSLGRRSRSLYCFNCQEIAKLEQKKYLKEYKEKNKEQLRKNNKAYRQKNAEKINAQIKEIKENNKEKYRTINREYQRKRYREDISYRLRSRVSKSIWGYIIENRDGIKLEKLPYTIQELKQHIESQFEWWMTWDNWGMYKASEWDDNDPNTWVWQIDHIIPQSQLPYDSMDHPNFKKCWSLENLRPLSAKQNIIDGAREYEEKTLPQMQSI